MMGCTKKMPTMTDGYGELISRLRELSEWAEENIWEVPIDLPDRLKQAANALEYAQNGVDTNLYDQKEVHENVTVEVWRNSYTGKASIGWYKNTKGENDGCTYLD